jgi:hypothetical protein
MKKYFSLSMTIIFAGVLLTSSCDLFDFSRKPKLPPITSEGKNTFGCMVDGKLWLPESRLGLTGFHAEADANFLAIYADGESNTGITIGLIDSSGIKVNKEYALTVFLNQYFVESSFISNGDWCDYRRYHTTSGRVTLSRKDRKAISGTFEFTVFNPDCGDTVKITDGRFDI